MQAVLSFVNFNQRFILRFPNIANSLTQLTGKDQAFQWTTRAQYAFDTLKRAFTTASIVTHFDPYKEILFETDASDYVSAGILSQHDNQNIPCPVTYFSKKHLPAECKYEIYNKELLAIIKAFGK